jgi:hypothetical protein
MPLADNDDDLQTQNAPLLPIWRRPASVNPTLASVLRQNWNFAGSGRDALWHFYDQEADPKDIDALGTYEGNRPGRPESANFEDRRGQALPWKLRVGQALGAMGFPPELTPGAMPDWSQNVEYPPSPLLPGPK